jgi:hypothetical protein
VTRSTALRYPGPPIERRGAFFCTSRYKVLHPRPIKVGLSGIGPTQAQVLTEATERNGNVEFAPGGRDVLIVPNTTEAILRGDLLL